MRTHALAGAVLLSVLAQPNLPAHAEQAGYGSNFHSQTALPGNWLSRIPAAPAPQSGQARAADAQSLSSSPASSKVGQPVILTAQFSGLAEGTAVAFRDGQASLGSASLHSGTASLTVTFASTGSHALTATAATSAGQSAVQATLAQPVTAASPTFSLVNSGSSTFGQPARLVATVSGASPTGTVTFIDGSTQIGSAVLANGAGSLSYTFTAAGTHAVLVRYAGDSRNLAAASAPTAISVSPAASATALTASTNAVPAGTAFTLTAKVSGAGATTGSVTFRDGSTVLGSASLSGGAATLGTSLAQPGVHSLIASFGGNANASASASATLSETVGPANSATTLASSANPAPAGRAVLLTARISGAPSSGSVVFKDGSLTLGTVTPSAGVASLTTSFATVGSHALTAAFSGNAAVAASTSPGVTEAITVNSTSTTVAASPAAPTVGQTVRVTATVSGWNPSGTVTFRDGSATLGTATVSGGSASLSTTFTAPGAHSLAAIYGGDGANASSISAAQALTVAAAATQTSLTASNTAPAVGQSVTLTARVTGNNPAGTVTFRNNSAAIGTATLSGGAASLTLSFSTAGSYSLTASYGGNSANAASTSSAVAVTVGSSNTGHPPATGNGIDYSGGPVMSSGVNVYYIWYGNWNGSPVPGVLNAFANGLGGSAWWHIATTYSDSSGKAVNDSVTLMGSTSDNYSQGKTLSDNGVFSVVSGAISSGRLPRDANGIYVVLSSADVDESSGFCTQYCGWHSSATLSGADIKFAFVGSADRCLSSCATGAAPNGSQAGDGMASVLAHEMAETVSDPDLNAWYRRSTGDENGDLCAWNFGTTSSTSQGQAYNVALPTGKFLIQQLWLNAQGGRCALSYP